MVTALQRTRLRIDIGDSADPPAFEDSEIDDLYAVAVENGITTTLGQDAFARVRAIKQLLANTAKRTSYTANRSSETLSDVFRNLKDLLLIYEADLEQALGSADSPVRWGPPRKKPRRIEEWPDA